MIIVSLFTRKNCSLCDTALEDLEALQEEIPHKLLVIDVDDHPDLLAAYGDRVPVVEAGPYKKAAPFTRQELKMTLAAAQDRAASLHAKDPKRIEKIAQRGRTISGTDRFSYWISNHYLAVFNLLIFIYVGLPFIAPVLMNAGVEAPAKVIYRVYGAVCHQLAFRSWFMYGDQPAYPRDPANVESLTPFGEATGLSEADTNQARFDARAYIGDETVGYKVAFCERDVAIYGAILLFGLIFAVSKRRLPPLPTLLWLIIGWGPIGLDGFSQLLSQPPFDTWAILEWLPYRESTPFLRTLTGALFGFTTAWFGYPYMEETFVESRQMLAKKFARIKELANHTVPDAE